MKTLVINYSLLAALAATGAAQALKVLFHYFASGKWDWRLLVASGGMPSSHSAAVSCLATSIGLAQGFDSPFFGIAAMLGLIVMYDAMGIRRHAGETAMALNQLEADFDKHIEEEFRGRTTHDYRRKHRRLKEMLGHQPVEVVAGALLGALLAVLFHVLWK
jgi:acid phosphatase family membrane protein YuiD